MKHLLLAALVCAMPSIISAAELKPGDQAPDFSLKGSDGKTYKLSDLKGKAVVIAWFPKAFTGGCTKECASMAKNGEAIRKFDVAYFTASTDNAETNKKFAESLKVDYPILSDSTMETAAAYGVLKAGGKTANRWTFYIDKDGKIAHIDKKVATETHGADVAKQLKALGVAEKK
jgi:peroxiredoxin Q/BCP